MKFNLLTMIIDVLQWVINMFDFKHYVLYTNIDLTLRNKSHGPNVLQNKCYMCIQWARVLYSVVITWHSNPPISQFNSPCNEFTSVWSMFGHTTSQTSTNMGKYAIWNRAVCVLFIGYTSSAPLNIYISVRDRRVFGLYYSSPFHTISLDVHPKRKYRS